MVAKQSLLSSHGNCCRTTSYCCNVFWATTVAATMSAYESTNTVDSLVRELLDVLYDITLLDVDLAKHEQQLQEKPADAVLRRVVGDLQQKLVLLHQQKEKVSVSSARAAVCTAVVFLVVYLHMPQKLCFQNLVLGGVSEQLPRDCPCQSIGY